ncbi:MAG: MBL fold metallo-hydrolase [Candidatus Omnitrophota bacterium]
MKIIIHRGTREIGGNCVELISSGLRILIDFGMPLVDSVSEQFDADLLKGKSIETLKKEKILADIKGLYPGEEKPIDAILISHSHLDHYGLLSYINKEIPVYMSKGAHKMINVSNLFLSRKSLSIKPSIIRAKKSFNIGSMKITPYVVDHSAFDALAFLIEDGDKRIFYSGDFRGHGRKRQLFENMVKYPPDKIDCLLMEGSMLGRGDQNYPDENAVQHRIEEILKKNYNITFFSASSQNIDRLVSAYKACLKTDSIFVIDIYTAFVLEQAGTVSKRIPQFNWKNVKIQFTKYHADILADGGYRGLLYVYNKRKIDLFEINRKKKRILMMARDNSVFPNMIKKIKGINGAKFIYSMWEGYLTDKFKSYCREKGIEMEMVHTSGHAVIEDLKRFAGAIDPKVLVPIHTFLPEKYPDLFENVKILKDEESLTV